MWKARRVSLLNREARFSIIAIILMLVMVSALPKLARAEDPMAGNIERGRQLYWRGLTVSGAPLSCATGNGISLSGSQLSCVSCHRPSGFGSSEGGKYVPPITGPLLFAPRELNRNRNFYKFFKEAQPAQFSARLREPRMRPAYTAATLARAIREGIDPANQKFDPEMPRCDLSAPDMANLVAYLKTLSAVHDPGVDAETVHLATIVTDNTDSGQREAVLSTISAFFGWMNTHIEGNRDHPRFSPNYHSDFKTSFQRWQLHVWKLHGPPATWNKQIRFQYEKQPVFAVVSGLVRGPWNPIARFCDSERLPCIFPNTELPKTSDSNYGYSIYFSRGLELEAESLASFLAAKVNRKGSIIQIHSNGPYGLVPAEAFTRAAKSEMKGARIRNLRISSAAELRRMIRRVATEAHPPDALVLWPGQYSQATLEALREAAPGLGDRIKIISLPSDALETALTDKSMVLPASLRFTYPYELPTVYFPRVFRVRQWMNSRKVRILYPRLQFQTYYALTMVQFGLDQILDDYYRDYLVEAIEHEAESHLDNGTHPALALGPGQRFASKGAYVVKIDAGSQGGFRAVSEWIVPNLLE